MKKQYLFLAAGLSLAGTLFMAGTVYSPILHNGMAVGIPGIQSINALAFAPDGTLFVGDSKSAAVFAVDTRDGGKADKGTAVEIKNIDEKIAGVLGTEVKNITIQDIAVNPVSKQLYCAVQMADGSPVLLRIDKDKITSVSLKDVPFSSISLNNVPAPDAKDDRGRSTRVWTISDLGFSDGKVMVSGLSNQEFSSTFRIIPFPFTSKQEQSSLEIYHAAHGQYETFAPIKTFTTADLNGKKYLVASYTCTPLVLFPLDDLKPGAHVKGRTVAEMGAGNSPLDMISMTKGGDSFLIMANSNRPVFKVRYKNIESYNGSLTSQVEEAFATAGVNFVSMPMVNVLQLDKLDATQFVILQRKANGDLDLSTVNDRWL